MYISACTLCNLLLSPCFGDYSFGGTLLRVPKFNTSSNFLINNINIALCILLYILMYFQDPDICLMFAHVQKLNM